MTTPNDTPEPSLASAGSVGEVLAEGIAEIIRIATEPEWIPVAERLPEEGERVLAWDNDFKESEVAIYYAHDGWGCDAAMSLNVTHWMKLPAPPSEGK